MPRPKVEIVDTLPESPVENDWLEEYLLTDEGWPGLGKPPKLEGDPPDHYNRFIRWNDEMGPYRRALYADPKFLKAATEFLELQREEPQLVRLGWSDDVDTRVETWAYRGKIVKISSPGPDDKTVLLIKHYVLRRELHYEKLRREVEAFENMEKLGNVSREPIPESVRLFVWQRDQGRCVKCSSQAHLEFDHIIPLAKGGSNTERNIQLLCESCNRSKGSSI